mmetsp:Transcript_26606/g.37475  ORF Transcript_26606/g.37475 Transcript_26606/m.37475 type:complete len:283 (+) Transcript_26606:243-1091(+)
MRRSLSFFKSRRRHRRCRLLSTLLMLLQVLCIIFSYASGYHVPTPPPAIRQSSNNERIRDGTSTMMVPKTPFLSMPSSSLSASLLLANSELSPDIRSQGEQIAAAMPLPTIRGQWRIRENRGPLMSPDTNKSRICTATIIFRGFIDEPNKGIAEYISKDCDVRGEELSESSSSSPPHQKTITGRWITKTTNRVVQLSARWKLRLPSTGGQRYIYKGFIDAGFTIGTNGAVSAEMTGDILTGEEVGKEKVVGTFRADLIKQFDSSDVKIGESNGAISLTPTTK